MDNKLTQEILMNRGGINENCLTKIMEPSPEDEHETNIPINILQQSPYVNLDNLSSFSHTNLFNIMSFNCRSINACIDSLRDFVHSLSTKGYTIHVIAIQEHWLSDNNIHHTSLHIEGYQFIYQPCILTNHSGVAFYLHSDFAHKRITCMQNMTTFELITIQLQLPSYNLTICNVYRPPRDNYIEFNNELGMLLENVKSSENLVLVGDTNINLIEINEKPHYQSYLDLIMSHGLCPTITLPSRLGTTKFSLLDHIFIKSIQHLQDRNSFIYVCDLSDHCPVFSSVPMKKVNNKSSKYFYIKKQGTQEFDSFKNGIRTADLNTAIDQSINADPNANYNVINNILNQQVESSFPLQKIKFNKKRHCGNPWMSQSLLNCVNKKNQLFRKVKKTKIDSDTYNNIVHNYRVYNSTLKRLIKTQKKDYYSSFFNRYKNNLNKTWSKIKDLVFDKKYCSSNLNEFTYNDTNITDPHDIANKFNEFFSSIGTQYANSIPDVAGKNFSDYLQHPITSNFSFRLVSQSLVSNIIDNLSSKNSCGHDGISVKLLKHVKMELVPSITSIINQSLHHGIFPDQLKLAKITPLYKSGPKNEFNNYRPISILPSVSKVLEKVISSQLIEYFEANNLLPISQYAYRKGHSTEHATLEFVDRLMNMLEQDKIPLSIYIDLSKAFDTLNHHILLEKLKYYGLCSNSIALLRNYLQNRQQYVCWNNHANSARTDITIGVPQGSILGPILFIIYMSDFKYSSNLFNFIFYADDTTLYLDTALGNINEAQINHELTNVVSWLNVNKLSVNSKKTKFMIFSYRKVPQVPNIILQTVPIEQVDHFNFLGLTIDKHLSWKEHVKKVANKLSRTNFILNRLKRFIPVDILRMIYFSIFHCHLNFGILCWGHTIKDDTSCDILTKMQKRAVRIITNSAYRSHTEPLFKALDILKLKDVYTIFSLKFIYKLQNQLLPAYFHDSFIVVRSHNLHGYDTRHNNIHLPIYNKLKSYQRIRSHSLKVLNTSPSCITDKIHSHTFNGFSLYAKKFYIDNYSYSCQILNCYICHQA